MTQDLAIRDRDEVVTLFTGATPNELIVAATDVANSLRDVVKQQRLYKRIGDRDHVLIEGWQTLGTLTGAFAVGGGVVELPWPATMTELPDEPPRPGRMPPKASADYPVWEDADKLRRAWEVHRDRLGARARGMAFGFRASYRVVKDGREIGWGEGRCDRTETNWVTRDDYALSSMAQTRGQSRALAAPLRFIVKLAGYASTPAEEIDGDAAAPDTPPPAETVLDPDAVRELAGSLQAQWPGYDAHEFVKALARRFDGAVPETAGVALRAWAWWSKQPTATGSDAPQTGAQSATDPQT